MEERRVSGKISERMIRKRKIREENKEEENQ